MRHMLLAIIIAFPAVALAGDDMQNRLMKALEAMAQPENYEREYYNFLISFKAGELSKLQYEFRDVEEVLDSIEFLVAVNCAFDLSDLSKHKALYAYRCGGMSFGTFSKLNLPQNISILRFVKAEDSGQAVEFLKNYLTFWRQQDCVESICISYPMVNNIEGVYKYVEAGGF